MILTYGPISDTWHAFDWQGPKPKPLFACCCHGTVFEYAPDGEELVNADLKLTVPEWRMVRRWHKRYALARRAERTHANGFWG